MPQANSFTVNDRESVPVAHVFSPVGEDAQGNWKFSNTAETVPLGRETALVRLSETTRYKVRLKFEDPVVVNETINGVSVPTVARLNIAEVNFSFDPLSNAQERKNLVSMVYEALGAGQTMLMKVFVDLEDLY